jgi:hypothetical protein
MIRGINPLAKTVIKELQPYNRGERLRRDPLWQLHWLDIEDNHRLPHVVLFAQMGHTFFVPDNLTADDFEPLTGAVERRAPIARYPAFDKTGAKVDVDVVPVVNVGFSKRAPKELWHMPVPYRLKFIHDLIINSVLRPLRPYLTRH